MKSAFEIIHSNGIAALIIFSGNFENVRTASNEGGETIKLFREIRPELTNPAQFVIIMPPVNEAYKNGIQASVSVYSGSGAYINSKFDFEKLCGEINAKEL